MRTNYKMPKIDLSKCNLTADELSLCKGIMNSKTGELRASKPIVAKQMPGNDGRYHYRNEGDANTGRTAYIWRMVAFYVSPISQHHCMPVTCEWELPGDFDNRMMEMRAMDAIVDKIVNSIPASEWHGVRRWGKALGH